MPEHDWTVAEALARAGGNDLDAWMDQVQSAGYCTRPVRLSGRVDAVDTQTGELALAFSSEGQPDGVILKACGSRRATRCEPCSVVYKGDARQLVMAGLAGGKGVPESVASHPAVFVTLTAPSFGEVHAASTVGGRPCHPGRRQAHCRHGRPRACWAYHDADDEVVGSPLCADCYDYKTAVLWNARASELWRRTTIGIGRALAGLLGIPVRRLRDHLRVSFAKVVEYQRRGALHIHALIRLDDPNEEKPEADVDVLEAAVRMAAARVRAPNLLDESRPIAWGEQLEVRSVVSENRRAVANYLAKYATKSTDDAGALDRRLSEEDLAHVRLSDHLRRLVETAWRLGGREELASLRLRHWAHCLGFRGHWCTKSRRWSTTFRALRAARQAWRLAKIHGGTRMDPWDRPMTEGLTVRIGSWTYAGSGYRTTGDGWLAASAAARAKEARRLAREERTWAA
jgi:hypothetical protein